jgi:hypothetical protein
LQKKRVGDIEAWDRMAFNNEELWYLSQRVMVLALPTAIGFSKPPSPFVPGKSKKTNFALGEKKEMLNERDAKISVFRGMKWYLEKKSKA